MIDLHCHIIYDTDDGAKDIENSISMIKEAFQAGFTKICCTPHYLAPQYVKSKQENFEKLNIIKQRVKEENIDIELFLGNEIYITNDIKELIKTEEVSTMANTNYVLVEFPMMFKTYLAESEINDLISRKYNVIIAHPERYSYVQKDIRFLDSLIQKGVYFQGNYESLLGKYGNQAKKTLIKLIKEKKIDFLSSDNHKENSTYTKMNKIIKVLKKYAKDEYFDNITKYNQEKVLKNIVFK
ncbi:MAG: hypothetical protein IKM97_02850 [Clostridia bacterium]|nr:hypothetical protein [Clostridia bacterium]